MPERKKGHVRNRSTGSAGSVHSDEANNDETSHLLNNDHGGKDIRKQTSTSNLHGISSVSSLHSISSQANLSLNTSRDRDTTHSSSSQQLFSLGLISSSLSSLNPRRKLYLIIGITAFILGLFATVNSFISIKNEGTNHNKIGKIVPDGDKFTIVLNTFKRHDMLSDALQHYSQCPNVKNIHVVWCEKKPPSSELTAKFGNRVVSPKIYFDIHDDSLNSRFLPLPTESRTDGILTVDDDMRISCDDLVIAHETWKSSPRTMVGFMPRTHLRSDTGKLLYRCWWSVWWRGKYSIVLTKAAFLHHDYFKHYTSTMPAPVREYVHKNKNCEDIAMQFLVANVSSLPPIFLRGSLEDLGVLGGISTQRDPIKAKHISARSACLNDMTVLFGANPLKYSRTFVERATNVFGNAPSTWWEYISSDMWSTDHGKISFLNKLDNKKAEPVPAPVVPPVPPVLVPAPAVPAPVPAPKPEPSKQEAEPKNNDNKNNDGNSSNSNSTSSSSSSKKRRRRRRRV